MTPVKNNADREDTPQADKSAHSNIIGKPDEQDAPISGRSPASKRTEEQASAQSQQSLKSTETEPLKKDEIHQRDSTKQDKVSGNIDSPNDINLKSKDKSNRAKESKSETASDKQSEEAKSSKASVKPGNICCCALRHTTLTLNHPRSLQLLIYVALQEHIDNNFDRSTP